jgi:hypothetical protein
VTRSVAERYLVAAFAFMASATWLGVSLTSGFACLFVFVLAQQAGRLYQGRTNSRSRSTGSRPKRPARRRPASGGTRRAPTRAVSVRDRSRPTDRVYDHGDEVGGSVAGEATW